METICDCSDVCGWTKEHTFERVNEYWECSNCGTEVEDLNEVESMISFECETHDEVVWFR